MPEAEQESLLFTKLLSNELVRQKLTDLLFINHSTAWKFAATSRQSWRYITHYTASSYVPLLRRSTTDLCRRIGISHVAGSETARPPETIPLTSSILLPSHFADPYLQWSSLVLLEDPWFTLTILKIWTRLRMWLMMNFIGGRSCICTKCVSLPYQNVNVRRGLTFRFLRYCHVQLCRLLPQSTASSYSFSQDRCLSSYHTNDEKP